MKYLLYDTVLYLTISVTSILNSGSGENVGLPDGYLLGIRVLQIDRPEPPLYYNHASLFKIGFDGSVTQFWNFSYDYPHILFSDNDFAIDTENNLVYLGVVDQLLALDLTTGEMKINISLQAPNMQYFWNYDYIPKEKALYGACTGHGPWNFWNWCRIKLNNLIENGVKVEFLYQFPGTNEYSPISDIYYMDKKHQSIWYFWGITYSSGVNYTTGKEIFFGNGTGSDICIAHDHNLNRTFTISSELGEPPKLGELHPWPKNATVLMKLPQDLRTASFGTCMYDLEIHTLIALMASSSKYLNDPMPTQILLIDIVDLSYKMVPLPGFRKWSGRQWWPITAVKYIH